MPTLAPADDAAWQSWRSAWRLRRDTTYLNHGSFGPPPEAVRKARRSWIDRLDEQPMDFFVRTMPSALERSRERLARFVGADSSDLVLTENATFGMNVLADSIPLAAGDEIVLTDHEYGAVHRVWQRACRRAGTREPRIASLPLPLQTAEQVVDAVFSQVTDRTRLIIVSHVTSPTAIVLPVQQICQRAAQRNVPVCVDGPHAPVQVPLDIKQIGCAFYTASCHKWLCAPFGSGFLFVEPSQQEFIEPQVLSWGTIPPAEPQRWSDEFIWSGTRDPSTLLAIPDAIDFIESVGLTAFRERTHFLARQARGEISRIAGLPSLTPDSERWYGSMVTVPLPSGDSRSLQLALWEQYQIEVPVVQFGGRRFIRVSCHLYNTTNQIQRLVEALDRLLKLEAG